MLINYNETEFEAFPAFKGGNGIFHAKMFSDGLNRILSGKLMPGSTIGLHAHETNSEIIFITSGKGRVLCNGAYEELAPGMCHYCPKGSSHSLINDGTEDLCFYAVVPEHTV